MIEIDPDDRPVVLEPSVTKSATPNLFLIGAPKCGTTSLYDYLTCYSSIAGGLHKEPHYFCDDFDAIRKARSIGEYLDFYKLSQRSVRHVIDASTCYLYSQTAVNNIIEFNPDAKIIVMVRNPIDLARSLHDHLRFRQIEPVGDLQSAWNLGPLESRVPAFARTAPYPGPLSYKTAGLLSKHVAHVIKVVPTENLQILFFDDLVQNRKQILSNVLEFIDVPLDPTVELEKRNEAKQLRSHRINRLLMYPPDSLRPIKSGVKRLLSDKGVRKLDLFTRINRKPPNKARISDALRAEMTSFFADDIRALGRLTDRNLDHWLAKPDRP